MYTYTYAHKYMFVYKYIYICIHLHKHANIYMYMNVRVNVYTCGIAATSAPYLPLQIRVSSLTPLNYTRTSRANKERTPPPHPSPKKNSLAHVTPNTIASFSIT